MLGLLLKFLVSFVSAVGVLVVVPGLAIRSIPSATILCFLLALVNAVLKRMLIRFSMGCSILALGPILLILNTMALWLAGQMTNVI